MVNEGKVMEEAKSKALQAALAQIEKQFGKPFGPRRIPVRLAQPA